MSQYLNIFISCLRGLNIFITISGLFIFIGLLKNKQKHTKNKNHFLKFHFCIRCVNHYQIFNFFFKFWVVFSAPFLNFNSLGLLFLTARDLNSNHSFPSRKKKKKKKKKKGGWVFKSHQEVIPTPHVLLPL